MAHFKFHLTVIFVLLAWGQMAIIEAVPPICIDPTLGACGPAGSCQQRCEAKYLPKVEGKCALGLCACYYDCNTKTPPGSTCTSNDGVCDSGDAGCASRCQSKYPGGTGSCQQITGTSSTLCLCSFTCPPPS
ncbi:hypothetical protein vseg_004562 [Gypsophila vaccaria]